MATRSCSNSNDSTLGWFGGARGRLGAHVLDHILESGVALSGVELFRRLVGGGERLEAVSARPVVGLQLDHLPPHLLRVRIQLAHAHLCISTRTPL